MHVIRIKNAAFYAYHGAKKEEQNIGGKFEADIDIYTDFTEAAVNDDLKKTINYEKVYRFTNKFVNEKKYFLIETIAYRLADALLKEFPKIKKVVVRIRKNSVPVGGVLDYVEAEVTKINE